MANKNIEENLKVTQAEWAEITRVASMSKDELVKKLLVELQFEGQKPWSDFLAERSRKKLFSAWVKQHFPCELKQIEEIFSDLKD